jgi:flagellar hook-basal body complex protein FliE
VAGGYYLYAAGGDPKKATKILEDDASRAASKLRSDASGVKVEVNEKSERVGEKFDEAVDKVRDKSQRADERTSQFVRDEVDKLDRARHDVAKDFNEKMDNFDKAVEKRASEAKGGILSWFSGKK